MNIPPVVKVSDSSNIIPPIVKINNKIYKVMK